MPSTSAFLKRQKFWEKFVLHPIEVGMLERRLLPRLPVCLVVIGNLLPMAEPKEIDALGKGKTKFKFKSC